MGDIIFAIFAALISVALFIYVSFTIRCKGPILSNTYLFASQEERKKIDKKAEYHMVSVVFSIVATIFAFLTVYIISNWEICLYMVYILGACVIVYAIKEAVKSEKNR